MKTGVVQKQTADLHGWCIHDFEIFSSLPSTFFWRSIENRRWQYHFHRGNFLEQWPCHIDRHPAIGHVNPSIKKGMALGVTFFAHTVTFSTRCRRNLICRDELC
jgi:hypothetical protein